MLSAHDLAALQTLPEVATIECHDTLGSTMDRGRELAGDGSVALPALVLATRQQAGRGRRGASWWRPPGSLAMTRVLESGAPPATGPLPLWAPACGLAVVEMSEHYYVDGLFCHLHVSEGPQFLHRVVVFLVLRPARSFGGVGGFQFADYVFDI